MREQESNNSNLRENENSSCDSDPNANVPKKDTNTGSLSHHPGRQTPT